MVRRTRFALTGSALLCVASAGVAQSERPHELMVGDPAPALSVGEWFEGEPIEGYEAGKIYVIDFWATWCGPCIAGFPHLSELQELYEDDGVVIIGLASTEAPDKIDNARALIEKKKDDTRYRVAYDDKESSTWNRMMKPAGKNGLPTVFIVDQAGILAYIGHPMNMDRILDALMKGETDGAREAAHYRETLRAQQLARRFNLLMQQGRTQEAYAKGRELLEGPGADQVNLLAGVAWTIVNPQSPLKDRDLDLGFAAAQRVAELTNYEDPGQLDTLAWAYFHRGERSKAIEIEEQALVLVREDDQATKLHLEAALRTFRGEKGPAE